MGPTVTCLRQEVPGHPAFGKHLPWATWKKACPNLGIKGVDLHGGTRHSSAQGLRPRLTPEAIKRLMGTHTNKAFERYFVCSVEELRAGYAMTRTPEKSAAAVLNYRTTAGPPKSDLTY